MGKAVFISTSVLKMLPVIPGTTEPSVSLSHTGPKNHLPPQWIGLFVRACAWQDPTHINLDFTIKQGWFTSLFVRCYSIKRTLQQHRSRLKAHRQRETSQPINGSIVFSHLQSWCDVQVMLISLQMLSTSSPAPQPKASYPQRPSTSQDRKFTCMAMSLPVTRQVAHVVSCCW